MEKTDTHTHTFYSHHGIGSVEEVVASAARQGLTTVALTEHLPLPPEVDLDGTFAMHHDEVVDYLAEVDAARARHPEIEVITGFEVDWRYGAEDYILNLLSQHRHELLLGSVHMLTAADGSQWEFDHADYIDGWYERGIEQVWQQYFVLWRDALHSAVPFTIMAHPDLPKKLGFKPDFNPRELYAAMAEEAAKAGVMVEVNTSGLHKPVAEVYPAPDLLHTFCKAGVPCTVSSDAHAPTQVGRDLPAAYDALRAAGYHHVTIPTRQGDRRIIPLD